MKRVYLAGPEVFLPNYQEILNRKLRICRDYDLQGILPADNTDSASKLGGWRLGIQYYNANIQAIIECDAVIANLSPFRSIHADVGTAFEVGYAKALGKPIFIYSNHWGTLLERAREQGIARKVGERYEDLDGMSIEDFDMFDNLMLEGASHTDGERVLTWTTPEERFTNLTAFETCVNLASRHLLK